MFEYQTPATLNQANPVKDTWYDILPATANVKIYLIGVCVEDANETLEVQVIIDGETIAADNEACTHSQSYAGYLSANAVTRIDTIKLNQDMGRYRNIGIEGKSVQVQVRKTTEAGAGNLSCIVCYGVKK